jgi:REP element-mobilizing transposase RayT
MNRGSDRQDIFSDDVDHWRYLTIVGDAVERGLIEVHAHAEMTNHFHTLARSPRGEISAAMHRIESEYARWYNERHRRTGPLFTGRFLAVPIESDDQLLTVARYIHRNPLSKVSHADLIAYPWSSYPVYAGCVDRPEWLSIDVLQHMADMDVESLRHFVERDLPADQQTTRGRPRPVTFQELVVTLGDITETEPSSIVGAAPGTSWVRELLTALAVELRVASTSELADFLGLASAASVRVLARRGRVRAVDEPGFAHCRSDVLASIGYAVPGTA